MAQWANVDPTGPTDEALMVTATDERGRFGRLRALSTMQVGIVARTILLLPAVKLSLRLRGMEPTSRFLATHSHGEARAARPGEAEQVADAVRLVSSRRAIGSTCLARSLTLWYLLRRRGIDAQLALGTRTDSDEPSGLAAHAWVEVDGGAVREPDDIGDRFPRLDLSMPRLARGSR
jgi:hypothetical protein